MQRALLAFLAFLALLAASIPTPARAQCVQDQPGAIFSAKPAANAPDATPPVGPSGIAAATLAGGKTGGIAAPAPVVVDEAAPAGPD
jgi:hypothetical protein